MITPEQWQTMKDHVEASKSGGARVLSNMSLVARELDAIKPPPEVEVIEFADFAALHDCGFYQQDGLLTGQGADSTTYQMTPHTSTMAGTVPEQGSHKTNRLRLIRVGGMSAPVTATGLEVANLTVQGTDQGHLYGGLTVAYSQAARIHDLHIAGIPGDAPGPPGETFGLELWHADGARLDDIVIDGRDASGRDVGATLLGLNSCRDVVIAGYTGHRAVYGMGIAIWDSADVTVTSADLRDNRHPINIENPHPGTMRFTAPDLRGQTDAGPTITCNGNIGSTELVITDPQWDAATYGPLRVGVDVSGRLYQGKPQLQRIEDVHVTIGGVDVSSDKSKVLIGNCWSV